jgi:hypothetical protein
MRQWEIVEAQIPRRYWKFEERRNFIKQYKSGKVTRPEKYGWPGLFQVSIINLK